MGESKIVVTKRLKLNLLYIKQKFKRSIVFKSLWFWNKIQRCLSFKRSRFVASRTKYGDVYTSYDRFFMLLEQNTALFKLYTIPF